MLCTYRMDHNTVLIFFTILFVLCYIKNPRTIRLSYCCSVSLDLFELGSKDFRNLAVVDRTVCSQSSVSRRLQNKPIICFAMRGITLDLSARRLFLIDFVPGCIVLLVTFAWHPRQVTYCRRLPCFGILLHVTFHPFHRSFLSAIYFACLTDDSAMTLL